MAEKIKQVIKNETVLVISSAAAILSCFAVLPDREYAQYIDFRVISLLFCLMAVVQGFVKSGFFGAVCTRAVRTSDSAEVIALVTVNLVFFSSMLVTNDVALITFVPLTIGVFGTENKDRLIRVIVAQTVAANLGSMATPVGNPQNLYIYSAYGMSTGEFFRTVLPFTAVSWVLVMGVVLLSRVKGKLDAPEQTPNIDRRGLAIYSVLFVVCILSVVRVLPYYICLAAVIIVVTATDRAVLRRVDYALLLTFAAFFIFVGNISRLDAVSMLVSRFTDGSEFLSAVVISQVVSNVPAAVMLSGFTQEARALLIGTNIGGLGTLIASLASLISFKLYSRSDDPQKLRYLGVFTLVNIILLAILVACVFLTGNG